MDEITVLDYLKFKLNPKNWGKEILPERIEGPETETTEEAAEITAEKPEGLAVRFAEKIRTNEPASAGAFYAPLVLLGIIAAIAAQIFIEPSIMQTGGRQPLVSTGLYFLSACCLISAFIFTPQAEEDDSGTEELPQETTPVKETAEDAPLDADESITLQGEAEEAAPGPLFSECVHYDLLAGSMVCALAAFILFGGNRFNFLNLFVWILSLLLGAAAFIEVPAGQNLSEHLRNRLGALIRRMSSWKNGISISFRWWNLLCIAVFLIGAWFRFYQLREVPLDMFSDQAEKLYDVMDVQSGRYPIFFTRNTGREAFQFYWTALIIKLFGTGISFLSLKIGTALAGIFILPFVYALGKRFGNRWVGLLAMLFCGTAYWPNVIGRVALRFAFYPMFTAPALWFLYKGLAERKRKDLILCGIFLGIGLHGYSPFRIVPVLVVFIFLSFLFALPKESRRNAVSAFMVLVFFAFLVFLPLGRAMVDMPDAVVYRALTRLGEVETSFEESPLKIFVSNLWKGLIMPFWDDGQTWVHSIVFRPALDHLTASFFFAGIILTILRAIRRKSWQDLWMLFMIPVLMLPSTLSIAFPNENPCLNRTGGAVIPIMIIAAYGFCACFEIIMEWLRSRRELSALCCLAALVLLVNICGHNHELVFVQYNMDYSMNAWNTTQIGEVIRGFADSIGEYEDAFVIPNPHWVDTRLVGINAGDSRRDYALNQELIETLPPTEKPRLFIFRESDTETERILQSLYPEGQQELHIGPYGSKNFYTYTILGSK